VTLEVESVSAITGNPVRAPANAAARDAYLRGRFYWFSDSYEKSREFFQEAIQLDPSYAAAYTGLADSYTAATVSGESSSVETMTKAETAARKALELDDLLPEAHRSLAAVRLFYRWDWEGAEKESERAIDLNPSLAEGHHLHAYVLETRNHMEEAVQEDKLTVELDSFARPWAYGYALIRVRRFDEALKELNQRSDARPDSGALHALLSNVYADKGDYARAIEELKKSFVIGGDKAAVADVDQAYRKGGFRAVNLVFLRNLKRRAAKEYASPLRMAEVAAGAGDKEAAIQYLEQAFQQRDPQLVHLQHDPELDAPLRPALLGHREEDGHAATSLTSFTQILGWLLNTATPSENSSFYHRGAVVSAEGWGGTSAWRTAAASFGSKPSDSNPSER
jgi:tetratricopeptide (TPR) repeat protein